MTNDTSVTDFPFLARQLTRKFLVNMLQDVVSRDSRGIILRETQERNFDIALLAHCHYITIQAKWDLFSWVCDNIARKLWTTDGMWLGLKGNKNNLPNTPSSTSAYFTRIRAREAVGMHGSLSLEPHDKSKLLQLNLKKKRVRIPVTQGISPMMKPHFFRAARACSVVH